MSFEDGRYFGEYFQILKSKIKKKYSFKNIGEKRVEIKKIAKEIKKRSGFSLSDVAINKIFLEKNSPVSRFPVLVMISDATGIDMSKEFEKVYNEI